MYSCFSHCDVIIRNIIVITSILIKSIRRDQSDKIYKLYCNTITHISYFTLVYTGLLSYLL